MRGKFGAIIFCALVLCLVQKAQAQSGPRFEISFPASVHSGNITGRLFIFVAHSDQPEPRFQSGVDELTSPFFGKGVTDWAPGQTAVIDASTLGYPPASLKDIPAGDYYVQALVNVYSEFHRADGHMIWAHMDQWEGQQFNSSPGNIYSPVQKIHLDPAGYDIKLTLSKVILPVQMPPDTEWVKHIKIQSPMLTRFWGRPIYLGATVLLPKGYETHAAVSYPVLYEQGHFSLGNPLGFRTSPPPTMTGQAQRRSNRRTDPVLEQMYREHRAWGYELYQAWISDDFPRMIVVTFQHPTPYFDDSYAVNSANNGPYGDALTKELIPYLENHFRMIREPYGRVLSGGSTGGWESLALQIFHPDFFAGTWSFYPDPVDFRRWQMSNIYGDENAFYPAGYKPGYDWIVPERPEVRLPSGQMTVTQRQASKLEAVLGSDGRSGQQVDAWFAVYGPVGSDGYLVPLYDLLTGTINHQVADYMRDHGYDLTYYLKQNWPKIGNDLRGKIHVYVGDMDTFYLNLAVYGMQEQLDGEKDPPADATFVYGRPMKPHGWQPMSNADLLRMMAKYIEEHSPTGGESANAWLYH
ncbi:MAG TPA: alpha/beta hydrolase-fold protein [Candidatus Acidoferrum sp.]|nr:alpha/beta hydrolase-fold protein [Candidatus Acidoferrum sp.]